MLVLEKVNNLKLRPGEIVYWYDSNTYRILQGVVEEGRGDWEEYGVVTDNVYNQSQRFFYSEKDTRLAAKRQLADLLVFLTEKLVELEYYDVK